MSEYRVIITETLKRAVTVEAESREEAEEAVRRQYQNSEHILEIGRASCRERV